MRIKLPTLLFGYILATVALVDTANRRRSKATMMVSPSNKDFMTDLFGKFDRLMEICSVTTNRSPPVPDGKLDSAHNNSADDTERIKFGFDKDEWKAFLRRLGFDAHDAEGSES